MDEPLLRSVDAVTVRVPDLDQGLAVYRDRLGHDLAWRNDEIGQAGLRLPGSDTELVLTTTHGSEPNWLVRSADEAAAAFVAAGGRILSPATDIPVGRLAVVADPFGNVLVLIDLSAGTYDTDADGNVTGLRAKEPPTPVPAAGRTTRPEVRIRDAEAGDALAVATVQVRAWQAAYRGIMPDDYLDDLEPSQREAMWRDTQARATTERHFVVAEVDGEVVGFATCGPARGGEPDVGELYALNAQPTSWGLGAGRALIDEATARLEAAGYRSAVLFVASGNLRARRFYERRGWASDGHEVTEDVLGAIVREVRYRRDLPDHAGHA